MPLGPVTALVEVAQIFVLQMNFIRTPDAIAQTDFQLIAKSGSALISRAQEKRTNVAVNYTALAGAVTVQRLTSWKLILFSLNPPLFLIYITIIYV